MKNPSVIWVLAVVTAIATAQGVAPVPPPFDASTPQLGLDGKVVVPDIPDIPDAVLGEYLILNLNKNHYVKQKFFETVESRI